MDDCVRSMWRNCSAAYIADFLSRTGLAHNVTRSMVMGRLNRLGLLGYKMMGMRRNVKELQSKLPHKPRPPKPIEPIPSPPLAPDMLMLHLYELSANSCRFIVEREGWNESVYCAIECEPQDRGPYCAFHANIMNRIPQPGISYAIRGQSNFGFRHAKIKVPTC